LHDSCVLAALNQDHMLLMQNHATVDTHSQSGDAERNSLVKSEKLPSIDTCAGSFDTSIAENRHLVLHGRTAREQFLAVHPDKLPRDCSGDGTIGMSTRCR